MHLAHHAQLTVPFYRLKELSKILRTEPGYGAPVRTSYLKILWRMIFAERKVALSVPIPSSQFAA